MHPARSGVTAEYSIDKLTNFDDRLTDLSNKIREHPGATAEAAAS